MAAQAKTVHALKPAEGAAEGAITSTATPSQSLLPPSPGSRHVENEPRRRMNVSERLAEGRGFWRGVFIGASFGAVAGVAGTVGAMTAWVPVVMDVAERAWAFQKAVDGSGEDLTVRRTGGEIEEPAAGSGGVEPR